MEKITLAPESSGRISRVNSPQTSGPIDVAFSILHGPMGEDCTVHGFLKLANILFVGSSVLGSAVGMDKDVMKRLLRDSGVPIGRSISPCAEEFRPNYSKVVSRLGRPFFVKPANRGSSVGVSKVRDEAGCGMVLEQAFAFDMKILIEEFISGREIECSFLGNSKPIASVIGERRI